MKKVYKKILGIVIFWVIGIVMFVHISYLLRPLNNTFFRNEFTGFYAEEEDTLDVVAIGSSGLYRYLDNPYLWDEYGLTSYNVGTPSQSCFFAEDLIDEIHKTQHPQLIIVETRRFLTSKSKSANSNRFCMVHDNMKYSLNRIELINSTVDSWSKRIDAYFDIITYHDSWEEFSYDNLKYIDNEQSHKFKGWKFADGVVSVDKPEIISGEETIAIPEVAEEALVQLMEKCQKENIQVLFVSTPWQIDSERQMKNRYIGNLIEEYGFNFLDCNQYIDEIGLDFEKDFYNSKHTNLVGAEKVTDFIGNYIVENYDIDTDHTQAVTDDWNNMLEQYNIEAEKTKAKIASR
ncbi:MAG: hypothetical protein ACI4S2_13695 [Lachnospiraceae bacterium]